MLIETTGIADPTPLIEMIQAAGPGSGLTLDAVVTVVDAVNFDRNLERAEAAYRQLAQADVLLINKCDAVDARVLAQIEAGCRTINQGALIVRCVKGQVDLDSLVELVRWQDRVRVGLADLQRLPDHDHSFESLALLCDEPIEADELKHFSEHLGPEVHRAKGVISVNGCDQRVIFQKVGRQVELTTGYDWGASEVRQSRIVVIGRRLEKSRLLADFQSISSRRTEGCAGRHEGGLQHG